MPFAGQFLSQLGPGQRHALARTTSGGMGATIYAVPTLVIIMSWLILGQAFIPNTVGTRFQL